MVSYSAVPTFAAFLCAVKKGFHGCTGEYFVISIGSVYLYWWYAFYNYWVEEVHSLHWKYRKYGKPWYEVINWDDVCCCKSFKTIKEAFCPKSLEKESESIEIAKEVRVI